MSDVNMRQKLPVGDLGIYSLLVGFVLECPSTTRHQVTVSKDAKGKRKTKAVYDPVSARHSSFRKRGITGHLLTTILAQIRRPLAKSGSYACVDRNASVEAEVTRVLNGFPGSDKCHDYIVYTSRDDMPDTEALFYYIRNAFAHGSFEMIDGSGGRVFVLESAKKGKVKARMRLKESTLLAMIDLSRKKPAEIAKLQRKKS